MPSEVVPILWCFLAFSCFSSHYWKRQSIKQKIYACQQPHLS